VLVLDRMMETTSVMPLSVVLVENAHSKLLPLEAVESTSGEPKTVLSPTAAIKDSHG
jgi:hypothetical protein